VRYARCLNQRPTPPPIPSSLFITRLVNNERLKTVKATVLFARILSDWIVRRGALGYLHAERRTTAARVVETRLRRWLAGEADQSAMGRPCCMYTEIDEWTPTVDDEEDSSVQSAVAGYRKRRHNPAAVNRRYITAPVF